MLLTAGSSLPGCDAGQEAHALRQAGLPSMQPTHERVKESKPSSEPKAWQAGGKRHEAHDPSKRDEAICKAASVADG